MIKQNVKNVWLKEIVIKSEVKFLLNVKLFLIATNKELLQCYQYMYSNQ